MDTMPIPRQAPDSSKTYKSFVVPTIYHVQSPDVEYKKIKNVDADFLELEKDTFQRRSSKEIVEMGKIGQQKKWKMFRNLVWFCMYDLIRIIFSCFNFTLGFVQKCEDFGDSIAITLIFFLVNLLNAAFQIFWNSRNKFIFLNLSKSLIPDDQISPDGNHEPHW